MLTCGIAYCPCASACLESNRAAVQCIALWSAPLLHLPVLRVPLHLPAGTDHLSICLESKDTEKSGTVERSCWCLFRLVLVAEGPGSQPLYRDSYGRFAADSKTGDNTSLGWNDFITMDEFS